MDFELTEEQRMMASTASDFTRRSSPIERVRKLREDPIGWSPDLWRQMGELGWFAIAFPESVGGFDGTFFDLALIIEQLGKTLVPEPILASVVLGGMTLLKAGSEAQHARYLAPMLEGRTSLALAYAEAGSRYQMAGSGTTAERSGASYVLSGAKRWVLNGHAADHLVVTATTAAGPGLFVVDRAATGLAIEKVNTIDGQRAALVTLNSVTVGADAVLGEPGTIQDTLDEVFDLGAAATVAEGLGICQTMLGMTTEYLKIREQFGRAIGSFQSLQHRAVDMFVEVQLLRAIAMESSVRVTLDDAAGRRQAVSAAKFQLATGGKYVAAQAIQLHGGIGCTDEHDIGLYYKRLLALNTLFGDEQHHVTRYAAGMGG